MKKDKEMRLPIVNPHAAGIDVGSRTHFVAISQAEEDVRSFGCYTADMRQMSDWLKQAKVTTIAMESTGSYWKGLFRHLQEQGFEVLLVNGKHTRNVKNKKTDPIDCKWIQRLHCLGLLSGSFLPDEETAKLKQYVRLRDHYIEQSSVYLKKMQQALRQMNIRLDVAIRDIAGKSGMAMVNAILNGERNAANLASLADFRVKKSKQEIALALDGTWQDEYVFELRMSFDTFQFLQTKKDECELEVDTIIKSFIETKEKCTRIEKPFKPQNKKKNKNAPKINIEQQSYTLANGVNLFEIEGVSDATVLTLLSEIGFDLSKFPTAKQFASWLALSPNNKISGGKVLRSHVSHHNNRFANALRRAANTIGNMKRGKLNAFFKRIAYRYDRQAAITATARKLAVIIWNMLTKNEPYKYQDESVYSERMRKIQIKHMQKRILALNVKPDELAFLTI